MTQGTREVLPDIIVIIIIGVIVVFWWVCSVHALILEDGGCPCWTYPVLQDEYFGPLADYDEFVMKEKQRDGCGNSYNILSPEWCCSSESPIRPLAVERESNFADIRIVWFCLWESVQFGPTNGRLIFFDTDVYVGFLPDPTCYEP